jgi:gluconate 2-dehydrogenase
MYRTGGMILKKSKVLIANKFPAEAAEYIARFCDCEAWEGEGMMPRELLLEKLSDIEGLLLSDFAIDEELLEAAPKLRAVSNVSVGYNNFDISAMKKHGVIGTNTPGVLNDTMADMVFGLMLSTARRIAELDRYIREGLWNKAGDDESLFGLDVHHGTLGIIGMGRIGETVARRARCGFDMEVCYYNRSRKPEVEEQLGIRYSELEQLLRTSDFIVLLTPLKSDTYHMIDHKEFDMMKRTAIFINASRGQNVNEKALIEALKQRKIYGAGLDVFESEPIEGGNPLLELPNVVMTPHIGTATYKTWTSMAMLAAENLVKALQGEIPPNIVPEFKK